jgi:hypothetical protein
VILLQKKQGETIVVGLPVSHIHLEKTEKSCWIATLGASMFQIVRAGVFGVEPWKS